MEYRDRFTASKTLPGIFFFGFGMASRLGTDKRYYTGASSEKDGRTTP